MAAITESDLFDMTDEDLEKLSTASFEEATPAVEETPPVEEQIETTTSEQNTEEFVEPEEEEKPVVESQENPEPTPVEEGSGTTTAPTVDTPVEGEPSIEELKAFYQAMNTPFKAGGSELKIRSAEEAIRLMQQGVGYTQRMQALAPQRKLVMMLEQHGLSDPSKLSYLIDLHNRNPEAIKKLLIDSKIDPMEIDTTEVPAYQASNHQVSDKDFAFKTQVEDIMSSEFGRETIEILDKWDQASQDALYQNPSDMQVIRDHVKSGFYSQVASEITRHKSLGNIPISTPFIKAYQVVAEEILRTQQAPATVPPVVTPPIQQTAPPVVVRTAPVAPASNRNNPSATAAVAPRQINTTKRQLSPEDIMNMSDEELAKLPPTTKW